MRVTRMIHPVGHGAFFSEHFRIKGKDCFHVVYDCGIKDYQKQRLIDEVEEIIGNSCRKHVDFLFISHLDEDHVNGIQYMINQKYVDDQTTFVLPLYKDYLLRIYEHFEGKAILSIYDVIRSTGSKSVFYVPVTEMSEDLPREDNNGRRVDMEDLSGLENLPSETVNRLTGHILVRGRVFAFREKWEYIPFNLKNSYADDFLQEIAKSKILDEMDLQNIEIIFANKCVRVTKKTIPERKKATEKYRELKRIYNSIGKGVKGDRRININSLALVSQAVDEVEVRIPLIDYERYELMIEAGYEGWCCYDKIKNGYGACTYTGDLNLSQDTDFDWFEKKVKAVLRGKAKYHLLQIPHHGSETSYNKRFCGGLSGQCFVNFNSENGIFDQRIIFDFFCARKRLIPVTEIESSRYEWECWV